jgi:hypothetical protein
LLKRAVVDTARADGRRSLRIALKIPIAVWGDGAAAVRAHTVVVNRHGALILAPRPFDAETFLKVLNQESGQTVLCRVVWCGGQDLPGLYKIGIEILAAVPGFWGEQHAAALAGAR